MRVLLLNQYYHPDIAATAQLLGDLGAELARRGHEVTAIASTRGYAGGARHPLVAEHAGVRILRVPATALGRGSFLTRGVDYASYLAGALPLAAAVAPDVVVALSTPPLVAALGLLLRARLVYWVMDVYPDVAVRLGALDERGAIARALRVLSRTLVTRADAVVALDEVMRQRLIAAGAEPSRVEVIDNWVDGDAVRPLAPRDNPLRRRLGITDTFTVSYSGNMGLGHDFETVTEAMALLRDEPIHWLFIGDGPRRAELEARVRASGARATFLPYRERDELPVSLTAADASLVTLADGLGGLLVPSKLYGILAAGLPVIYVGPPEGRVAAVVEGERVGVTARNGDAAGLARGVRQIAAATPEAQEARAAMGQRARRLFETRFARPLALERHHALLCRVAGAPC
jgi:glycosyltransferase involved in cell wall biosynthesis